MRRSWLTWLLAASSFGVATATGAAEPPREGLGAARNAYLAGRYDEAAELYAAGAEVDAVTAAVGLARCHTSVGKSDEAVAVLKQAASANPQSAEITAELARLALDRGDYVAASEAVDAALADDADSLLARWVQTELWRLAGRLDEANKAYEWFVNYYNNRQVDNPEAMRWIALAAAQFARWNRLPDQFRFLVNELLPDMVEIEPDFWPAHYEAALLYLEKFNEAEAQREIAAALKINAHSAEVHAAAAKLALSRYDLDEANRSIERALEINPRLVMAHQLRADALLANYQVDAAIPVLEEAIRLNPVAEETLGRLAATYVIRDGWPADASGTALGELIEKVTGRNEHAGEFYYSLGTRLEERRKFPEAERAFREAAQRMPQFIGPQAAMGMMYMRLGREDEARVLLDAAFEADPFNLRVSNTLQVLEVLSTYETLETDHFVIRYDRAHDNLLARYAARHLERVFPKLCAELGYTPMGKSLFEIFNRAKNTGGHGWFSARMIGLPYVGTVGACAGTMVALTSPAATEQPFNWARVVEHELVHVINLQQTNFNIPHWFTEALAVSNEGYPRPELWNQLLAERVPKGEIFNLETINLGFIRPKSSLDWQMAYCQAELYAEFIRATYGADSIARLLAAYAENLNTQAAIRRALGVDVAELEQGYAAHLQRVVAELGTGTQSSDEMSLTELVRAAEADPKNPDLLARLAQAQLARRAFPEARRLARQALAIAPKHQLAAYVIARLHVLVGDTAEAVAQLESCLDADAPQENLLDLLAALRLKGEQYAEAARLYELGAKAHPLDPKWPKRLARVYLLSHEDERLAEVLKQLARIDADDVTVRKKLAQLALAAKNYAAAVEWGQAALEIDVTDSEVHRMLAEALVGEDRNAEAVEEYEAAIELNPQEPGLRFALAERLVALGQTDRAKEALEALLKLAPEYPGAELLLKSLMP